MAKYQEKIDISFTYDKTGVKNIQNQLRQIQKLADKPLQIGSIKDLQQVSVQMDKQGQKMKEVIRVTDEFGNKWNVNMQKAKKGTDMLVNSVKLSSTASKDHAAALNNTKVAIQDAQRKAKEYMAVINEHTTSTGMKEEAKKLQQELNKLGVSSDMTTQDLKEMGANAKKTSKDLGSISRQASIAGKGTLKLGHMIRTAAKAFTVWISVTAVFFRTIQEIKRGIEMITNLDTALVELRKVSDLTVEGFDEFIGRAQKVAQTVARTSAEVTQATADFARMGYTVRESLALAEQALILVNVGDGIENVDQATQSIISTLKGFQMEATEASHIVDGLNEVANNFAVTTSDLADGVQRAGSTLAQSGTTYEETLGLLTATNEVLQKMEKSSTGLITISQRIRGVSEAFEDGEAPVNFTAKLGEAYKQIAGVDIMVNGQLRSTYDILNDMSKAWSGLTTEQQQYLGELSAGKRRVNVFNALMTNTKTITEATAAATDSFGSALEENEKKLDSIEGKVARFNEAVEAMWTNAIDRELIKDVVDLGTSIINLIDEFGLLNGVIMIVISAFAAFKNAMFLNIISSIGKGVFSLVTMQGAVTTLTAALGVLQTVMATVLPLLAIGAAIYGIKKLKEYRENVKSLENSFKDLKDILESFEEDKSGNIDNLGEAVAKMGEDLEKNKVRERLREIDSELEILSTRQDVRSKTQVYRLQQERKALQEQVDEYNKAKQAASLYSHGNLEVAEATEEAKEEILKFSDSLRELYESSKKLGEEQQLVKTAIEELNTAGNLSQETYESLIEINEDYIQVLGLEKQSAIELLNANLNKSKETLKAEKEETNKRIQLIKLRMEAKGREFKQIKTELEMLRAAADDPEEQARIGAQLDILRAGDINNLLDDLSRYEQEVRVIDNTLAMFNDTTEEAGTSTKATTQELEKFYDQLRAISDAKYLLDMAETSEEQKIAIEKLISALKNYNSELQTEISRLDSLVDVTDGISSAEVEHINARDELIDVLRSNNIEIQSLESSYKSLLQTEQQVIQNMRDNITEVENVLIQIIQKRGELEKEAAQEDYESDIDKLEEELEEKIDLYDQELEEKTERLEGELEAVESTYEAETEALESSHDAKIERYENQLSAIEDIYDRQKEAATTAYEEEIAELDKKHDEEMQRYDDELDAFRKMIQEKKRALQDQFAEEDYQDKLSELRNEEAEIQAQINVLKLRDDVEARAMTIELEEQLADKRNEIADAQTEHERDSLITNLDDRLSETEEYYENVKDEAETTYQKKKDYLDQEYQDTITQLDNKYNQQKKYYNDLIKKENETYAEKKDNLDTEYEETKTDLENKLERAKEYYGDLKDEAQTSFDDKKELRDQEYDETMTYLDNLYNNANTKSEARKALIEGEIKGINGEIVSLEEAYVEFENTFGDGMTTLGGLIKTEFIDKINDAISAVEELFNLEMPSGNQNNNGGGGDNGGGSGGSSSGESNAIVMTPGGEITEGYIDDEGHTYLDPEHTQRVEEGSFVETEDGTVYELTPEGGKEVEDATPISSMEVGTTNVPNDGLVYLHKGEAVIPNDFNPFLQNKTDIQKKLFPSMFEKNNSSSQYDIDINVAGNLDKSVIPNLKKAIEKAISEKDRENFRRNKKIGVYNV